MSTDAEKRIISKESLIPIGAVVAIVCAAMSLHLWLSASFTEINTSLNEIKHRMDSLENGVRGSWSAQDMKVWEMELRQRNPSMSIPDTWNVIRRQADPLTGK